MKSGRTHWMDAVPVTLGQEFGGLRGPGSPERRARAGHAAAPRPDPARRHRRRHRAQHASRVRRARAGAGSSRRPGLPISAPADPFEAQAARDGLVEASGALKTVAVSLTKIANDLRFMGSGPRAGLAEIALPELQKGSSIMPGKVNPVIPEVVTQVAAQVIGNDQAIAIGGMQGHFELNVFIPMMARNLLDSIRLLASASPAARRRSAWTGSRRTARTASATPSSRSRRPPRSTRTSGTTSASEIVKEAARSGRSLREVAREAGVDEATLDEALDYRAMAKPHD